MVRVQGAARELAVFAFFVALAVVATRPLALDLTGSTLAGWDPLLELWAVNHVVEHLFDPLGFFDGNVFHPYPNTLLYSDYAFGSAILVWPLRPLGLDPVTQFNLATLLALTFSGWAFSLLARELSGSFWGGVFAGVGAAFASHQMLHVVHLNLLSTGWLALMLLGLQRCLHGANRRRAVLLAGAGFAFTAMSSGYYAIIATLVALCWVGVNPDLLPRPAVTRRLAQAGVVAALMTAPYVWTMLSLRGDLDMARAEALSEEMSFLPARDLTSGAWVYSWALGAGGQRLFPGLIAVVLAGLALRRRGRVRRTLVAVIVVLGVLSLGPAIDVFGQRLPLPYAALSAIPPLDAMRHPYTFAAIGLMLLFVLAARGWSTLELARRPWTGPALVALGALEVLGPAQRVAPIPEGVPSGYAIVARLGGAPSFELPVRQGTAHLWAARHGLRVANGYGAFEPPYTTTLHRTTRNHWMSGDPGDVDASKPTRVLVDHFPDVRYLIVPTRRHPGLRRLVEALDRSHTFVFVQEGPDGDRVYEIRHPGRRPGGD